MAKSKIQSRRYVGMDLTGAKNHKTTLASLEYYPKEQKIFLLDLHHGIGSGDGLTGDSALLSAIKDCGPNIRAISTNVPLSLPPCITCRRRTCPMPRKCSVPEVKWMREETRRAERYQDAKEFTPYTQRPLELFIRYRVLPMLSDAAQFEIDEALGGNKAPLTARMHFLKFHLKGLKLYEAWPKLTVSILGSLFHVDQRTLASYRRMEEGAAARTRILEIFAEKCEIFVYDRDARKLATNLASFDAFICAYTALLSDTGHCIKAPRNLPRGASWVQFPEIELS